MNKYNIKKITLGGVTYDSEAEGARHFALIEAEKKGEITALHYHGLRFYLGKSDKNRSITYRPDFIYIEDGQLVAEEIKGPVVRDFPVRMALFKEMFPEWMLRVRYVNRYGFNHSYKSLSIPEGKVTGG